MTDPAQVNTFIPEAIPPSTGCIAVNPVSPTVFTLFKKWKNLRGFSDLFEKDPEAGSSPSAYTANSEGRFRNFVERTSISARACNQHRAFKS